MIKNPYAVKSVVLRSGERLPTLVTRATGEPLYEPSIYVLSEIRATNRASNTIDGVLRSIMVLQLFLESSGIDIDRRFREGRVFSLSELDRLVRHCRRWVEDQLQESQRAPTPIAARGKRGAKEVSGQTAANRVRSIRDYLDWLVRYRMSRCHSTADGARLWDDWNRCKDGLDERIPRHKGRNTIGQREGLAPEVVEKLLAVTAVESPDNPWKGKGTRVRNCLMVRWFLQLGLRRGELLNVKIHDINFRSEEVVVARRADDAEDPRQDQPLVKTRDRKLPLSSDLCFLTHDYITTTRRLVKGARRHPFLFVATATGAPLSLSSVNQIFADLREAFPEDFGDLTPHVLRHTWNDRFSEAMDSMKVPEGDEEGMRSFLMGWSDPKTAVNYTRRHVRLRARQVSLEMQAKQAQGVPNND